MEDQSAFFEGRSIHDNAIIAIHVIHAMKSITREWRGDVVLKIDIRKTYDKVDWVFLKGVLLSLSFDDKWIHWMMLCTSYVNY